MEVSAHAGSFQRRQLNLVRDRHFWLDSGEACASGFVKEGGVDDASNFSSFEGEGDDCGRDDDDDGRDGAHVQLPG